MKKQYIILRTHCVSNPYNHLSMALNTHTKNPNGDGKYMFKIGDIITEDGGNNWDVCFFLTPDGERGKIDGVIEHLLKDEIIKEIVD